MVRKHKGIQQTGGNKGQLKKGYRYSGKKLKSGIPEIIKITNEISRTGGRIKHKIKYYKIRMKI